MPTYGLFYLNTTTHYYTHNRRASFTQLMFHCFFWRVYVISAVFIIHLMLSFGVIMNLKLQHPQHSLRTLFNRWSFLAASCWHVLTFRQCERGNCTALTCLSQAKDFRLFLNPFGLGWVSAHHLTFFCWIRKLELFALLFGHINVKWTVVC